MASGFKRSKGASDYVFVNGQAVRVDASSSVPGGQAASAGNSAGIASAGSPAGAASAGSSTGTASAGNSAGIASSSGPTGAASSGGATRAASSSSPTSAASVGASANAAAFREQASPSGGPADQASMSEARQSSREAQTQSRPRQSALPSYDEPFYREGKRVMRRKYLVAAFVLLVCMLVSFCADPITLSFRSPAEVLQGAATWFSLLFDQVFRPADYADARMDALTNVEYFSAVMTQVKVTLKYALCGMLLAISGMLYQNAFRNPIAAPSMLGVTNGINFAVIVLVLQFGWTAFQHPELYYLYSYIGGVLVLLLVMFVGKWTSRKGGFNVVNMILVGTITSQLLGVLISFVQVNFLSDTDWEAYSMLTQAMNNDTVWTYVSLALGTVVALVPVIMFRFRLNLVSFSDEETRLLGVDPTRLRLLALGCGSIMILTAQVNAGQVAMISLVVPFVVRAVFGSEFRTQLLGNVLVGAILLVVCGLLSSYIIIGGLGVGLSTVTTVIALPLFVWMIAIRQRSWD